MKCDICGERVLPQDRDTYRQLVGHQPCLDQHASDEAVAYMERERQEIAR